MANPLSEPIPVYICAHCDKCGRSLYRGEFYHEVKNKRLRKKGLDVICHYCAEGILKEWEAR